MIEKTININWMKSGNERIKKMTQSWFLICCLLLVFSKVGNGQDIELIEVLPNEEKEFITGIAQDENGIMWFSNKKGLLSYDGKTTRLYANNPSNPNSLASNFIESLFVDKNGEIWLGTLGSGLDHFNTKTGIFTHFRHNPDDEHSISNDTITQILRDKHGNLWIGSHGGLNKYNSETNSFTHYQHDANDATSISNNQVRAIYEDRKGNLWIGTGSPYADNGGGPDSGGLNRMDIKSGTFTRYLHDSDNENSLISNKVTAINEDDAGNLLIGTRGPILHRLNLKDERIERLVYDPRHPEKLSSPPDYEDYIDFEHITFISTDSRGRLWYGTTEHGIYSFDRDQKELIHIDQRNRDDNGFFASGAWSAFTSHDGILWIGSVEEKIYCINPNQKYIPFYETSAEINGFYKNNYSELWIATNSKVIRNGSQIDLEKEDLLDITSGERENDIIQCIDEDRQKNIWIGGTQGLYLWNDENQNLIQYKHDSLDEKTISQNIIYQSYEDSRSIFWVGTVHGLNIMDRSNGTFKRILLNEKDTSFIGRNIVTTIIEDKNGQMWAGLWNNTGLYAFDSQLKTKKKYLNGINIVTLFLDNEEELWVGSNYGLYRYDEKEDVFQRYFDPSTNLSFTPIMGIVEDEQNYLWLSTKDNIIRINPERTESNTLGKTYGIEKPLFRWKSIYKDPEGMLYFGTDNGYFYLDPANTIQDSLKPKISITALRVNDQILEEESNLSEDSNKSNNEIRLSYDQNVFSFDFAVMDYVNPEENKLLYTLENYDKSWLQPNSNQRVYYFNVPPGNYTFRIKAANSYGVWSEKVKHITILPPWWKTWWAYGIYAFIFVMLIISYDRIQRRRLILKAKQNAKDKELEQAKEIQKAYTELKSTQEQLVHAEKMASLGELTAGIAHEIQNPLNFINNFSEVNIELIEELNEEIDEGNIDEVKAIALDIVGNENRIMHHGKRADAIVKNMLQHSRGGSEEKHFTNINALADEYLRLSYHGLRAKNKSFNADFKTDLDEELPKVKVVPQDIGRVLLNLINNAFHAVFARARENKDGEYKALVFVQTKKLEDKVQISVKDNGGGIPLEIQDKIFQPFFTTKAAGEGTGLGLSLSFDIVSKGHGGDIKLITEEGVGTEFIVELPLK